MTNWIRKRINKKKDEDKIKEFYNIINKFCNICLLTGLSAFVFCFFILSIGNDNPNISLIASLFATVTTIMYEFNEWQADKGKNKTKEELNTYCVIIFFIICIIVSFLKEISIPSSLGNNISLCVLFLYLIYKNFKK